MTKVFLSHSNRDAGLVAELARELHAIGLVAIESSKTLAPGASISSDIRRKVREADALVVVVGSPHSVASSWIWYETGLAEALGKPVLILVSNRHPISELPAELATWRRIEFDPQRLQLSAIEIAEVLKDDRSGNPRATPPSPRRAAS